MERDEGDKKAFESRLERLSEVFISHREGMRRGQGMSSEVSGEAEPQHHKGLGMDRSCAFCEHLVLRKDSKHLCRVFGIEYVKYGVQQELELDLNRGRECPFYATLGEGANPVAEAVSSEPIPALAPSEPVVVTAPAKQVSRREVSEWVTTRRRVKFVGQTLHESSVELKKDLVEYLQKGYEVREVTLVKREEERMSSGTQKERVVHVTLTVDDGVHKGESAVE